jgi:hypothetical protein
VCIWWRSTLYICIWLLVLVCKFWCVQRFHQTLESAYYWSRPAACAPAQLLLFLFHFIFHFPWARGPTEKSLFFYFILCFISFLMDLLIREHNTTTEFSEIRPLTWNVVAWAWCPFQAETSLGMVSISLLRQACGPIKLIRTKTFKLS